jgi:photosystem II stability/assembly factor-like uncharacterized protein
LAWVACSALAATIAACGGPAPNPTPTVAPAATATTEAQPTATSAPAQTPTVEATPTLSAPSATATVEDTPTAVAAEPTETLGPPPSYTWQAAGLATEPLRDLAMLPGGGNVVLVAGPGGVWRSEYNYTNWEKLPAPTQPGGQPPGNTDVAIASPQVYYLALHTGCASGLPMNSYRSTDAGATWTDMGVEINAISASGETTAYATTCTGVIKTTDSGATWSDVLPGSQVTNRDPYSLVASPDGQTVFASYASEGGTGTVQRSTDGGATWQDVTPTDAPDGALNAVVHMVFVPGTVGRPEDGGLYMANNQGTWYLPLESDDWRSVLNPPSMKPGQDPYVTALFVDTAYSVEYDKPGPVMYAARAQFTDQGQQGLGAFRSANLGTSWQPVGDDLGGKTITGLALAPRDDTAVPGMVETLVAATTEGVYTIPMPPPFR